MKWISINHELPPEEENVILFDGDDVFCGDVRRGRDGKLIPGMQSCDGCCYGWCGKKKVTHWMPLPPPPPPAK